MPDLDSTLAAIDAATAEDDARDEEWRRSEFEIEGGYCGREYPRLWPPRRRIDARGSQ